MAEKVIEIEAEFLEEARKQIKAQIPRGLRLLSETVISDGMPRIVKAAASTTEDALSKAQSELPINAVILGRKVLATPSPIVITVEALDEQSALLWAKSEAEMHLNNAEVKSVKLKIVGSRGFLGFGKKPNRYEAELLQPAIVEITYKTKAKISVKIGEKRGEEWTITDWVIALEELPIVLSSHVPKCSHPNSGGWDGKDHTDASVLAKDLINKGARILDDHIAWDKQGGGIWSELSVYRIAESTWRLVINTEFTD